MIQSISGKVIKGDQLGRKIGFKTANIKIDKGSIEYGVYKINIVYKDDIYHGVGTYLEKKEVFESHIFNFDKEIYGENIEIILLEKIRENKKFDKLKDLIEQIKKDIEYAKNIQYKVLTFGTFDFFHPGHEYYLKNSKKYGDILITIIGTDKNVERIKGKIPIHKQEIRKINLEKSKISDIVVIGDENDPLKWVKFYKPQVICLGYDQNGFSSRLKEIENIEIIRLKPFKENIYKSSLMNKNK